MKQTKKFGKVKKCISLLTSLFFIALIIYLIPIMKDLTTQEGQAEFKELTESLGMLGILLLFGLQVAQIALVILPGEPLEFLAGMCYGTIGGTIFILISTLLTSLLIYFLVKKIGKKYVYEFFDKEKIDKIEKNKIFKNPKTVEYIILFLFIIPGTPKDLLVYLGGLLPIKPIRFLTISTLGRLPSVISSTIAGAYVSNGNWKMSLVIYILTFIITGIFVLVSNKLDKNKITTDAINTIK